MPDSCHCENCPYEINSQECRDNSDCPFDLEAAVEA